MAISKAEILDAVSAMTVLDLSELIKDMEEKFGVSAAAAAVIAAATTAAADDATSVTISPWAVSTANGVDGPDGRQRWYAAAAHVDEYAAIPTCHDNGHAAVPRPFVRPTHKLHEKRR